ncbi:HD domain-containing protein [Frisingicoccus sp.]|uniref:Ppx/GppA phosphatase family protein n=1 Tax=Frisingicoccus sp. TaxID=1918627 RepID=UPI0025C53C96|nr:HD domain-containing protein [Frisingicoccus sp.]
MPMQMLAAIDVGSSEVAMKIYQFSKRTGIEEIEYVRSIVELGADTYNTGVIAYDTVRELCGVLGGFVQKLKEYRISNYVAYAGSAMREAVNRDLVLDQIRIQTGLEVQIIGNAQQRFLVLQSLAGTMVQFERLTQEGVAIVDLSSGSLQVSIYEEGALQVSQNLKLGSLRVREILADMEQQTTSFVSVMEDYIGNTLRTFQRLAIKDKKIKHVIVLGEEIATLLNEVNASKNRESFNVSQFEKFYMKLMRSKDEDISKKYNIPYETATVLKPSMIIFKNLVEMLGGEVVWASNVGLCDGILADYIRAKHLVKNKHDFTEDIISMSRQVARHYESDMDHTNNVEALSLAIFDSIKKISGLSPRDRLILQAASILHDCGKYVNMMHGTDNAYYLVLNTEIIGFSEDEKHIIANVIRFNSNGEVPEYTEVASEMSHMSYVRMLKMAAILRLANGMDRSHLQRIQNVRVTVKDAELKIMANTIYDITLEQGMMETRANFFEQIYGLRPVLRQKRRV